jgi:hypothetical protein
MDVDYWEMGIGNWTSIIMKRFMPCLMKDNYVHDGGINWGTEQKIHM